MEASRYRRPKIIILSIIAGIFIAPMMTQAEIYRWTDASGKVHFSDKPDGAKVEKLDIKVNPASAESIQIQNEYKQKADNYLRARQEEREIVDQEFKAKIQLAEKVKQNCKKAKAEYKKITEASVIYFKNKDGTRDYLETDRREKEEARLKENINKWCK